MPPREFTHFVHDCLKTLRAIGPSARAGDVATKVALVPLTAATRHHRDHSHAIAIPRKVRKVWHGNLVELTQWRSGTTLPPVRQENSVKLQQIFASNHRFNNTRKHKINLAANNGFHAGNVEPRASRRILIECRTTEKYGDFPFRRESTEFTNCRVVLQIGGEQQDVRLLIQHSRRLSQDTRVRPAAPPETKSASKISRRAKCWMRGQVHASHDLVFEGLTALTLRSGNIVCERTDELHLVPSVPE